MTTSIDLTDWFLRYVENSAMRHVAPPPIEFQHTFDAAVQRLISGIRGPHPDLKSDIEFFCAYRIARFFGVLKSLFAFMDKGVECCVSASFEGDEIHQPGELIFRFSATEGQGDKGPSVNVVWRVSMSTSLSTNDLPARLGDIILSSMTEGQLLSPPQLKVVFDLIRKDCIVDTYQVNDDQASVSYNWHRFPFTPGQVNDITITLKKAGRDPA